MRRRKIKKGFMLQMISNGISCSKSFFFLLKIEFYEIGDGFSVVCKINSSKYLYKGTLLLTLEVLKVNSFTLLKLMQEFSKFTKLHSILNCNVLMRKKLKLHKEIKVATCHEKRIKNLQQPWFVQNMEFMTYSANFLI